MFSKNTLSENGFEILKIEKFGDKKSPFSAKNIPWFEDAFQCTLAEKGLKGLKDFADKSLSNG